MEIITLIHTCLITYIQRGEENNISLFNMQLFSEFPLEFPSMFLYQSLKSSSCRKTKL